MKKDIAKKETLLSRLSNRIEKRVSAWLLYEEKSDIPPFQNFKKMSAELHPADVLLFEGKSRISLAISVISQSQWTHAALYIGRCSDYAKGSEMSALLKHYYTGDHSEPLVVESLLGKGMVITPLSEYAHDSIRLCRPRGILKDDAVLVVEHAVMQLGREYDLRQLLDLARFIFPYRILPRRWLSTLFNYKAGEATRTVCSTVLAEAFMHVKFPVLPILEEIDENISVRKRNPRLITPRDFDYSPYFEIIKFPNVNYDQSFFGLRRSGGYREMPWEQDESTYCDNANECEPKKSNDAGKPISNEAGL